MVHGYKVFNSNWECRGKQYTCPGRFEEDVKPQICEKGMHFCKKAADCFDYYRFAPDNKVAEVAAYGTIVEEGNKCCTDKLEIIREIPWQELLEIANTGKGCTGLRNSGNQNSGNCNSGDFNSGNRNSGNCNSGNQNSGNCNSGDFNSGDWNKTNFSNGCFNTVEPKIYLFNKPSEWTYKDWTDSPAYWLLSQMRMLSGDYVSLENMTKKEKAAHPEAKTTGGYVKKLDLPELAQRWWKSLNKDKKNMILELPNFDKDIFEEITGVNVDE